jgi:hypothetical protein
MGRAATSQLGFRDKFGRQQRCRVAAAGGNKKAHGTEPVRLTIFSGRADDAFG